MFHTILFAIILLVDTAINAFAAILVGIFNPYARLNSIIMRIWGKILVWAAGIKLEVRGLENIGGSKSFIIVGNHQSHMDIPVSLAALPLSLRIISKKELFKIPVFGWGMRAAGIIEVDRSNRKQAFAALEKVESVVRKNELAILAFPEGTRSTNGKIHPFKKGPFVLAINTGLPILPVSISGTRKILPKGSLKISGGKVLVQVHPPISTKDFNLANRNDLVKQTHEIIVDGFIENYR